MQDFNTFSSINRASIIQQMNNSLYDLIVIGGGITGAGIALDATARGLKVALIEMQDFAAGTSSRSTKLIHGGLRYLKQLEFKLVAEVGKERRTVHNLAPHITIPEPMLLPIVKGGSFNMLTARMGIGVYELLAGVSKKEWHYALGKEETMAAEPLLRKDILLGGIIYHEYRTDDARLTLEVMKEAVSRGAMAVNYAKAISFVYQDKKISGVKIQDQLSGEEYEVHARYVVNATGPWVDELDNLDLKQNKSKLHITKGVHLVVDGQRLPVKQSVYFDTPDKRMIFIIPREGKAYIGTTDTFYKSDLVDPKVTDDDRDYILNCVNNFFPGCALTAKDVESCWAGLRPLVNKPGKGPSEISRKDEMFESASGLITIAGGKLTGYRKMAQRVVDLIAKRYLKDHQKTLAKCSTSKLLLSGGISGGAENFKRFVKDKVTEGISLGLTNAEADLLTHRYGTNIEKLFEIIENIKSNEDDILPASLRAQLRYAAEEEMCTSPADFFIRRTGMLYFDIAAVIQWKEAVLQYMQKIMGWDDELKVKYEKELNRLIEEANNGK